MPEFWTAIKTETQIILAPDDRKFRATSYRGNFVARDLAQHAPAKSPELALESPGENRHCPPRFQRTDRA
jgi:hypothetical protein